MKQEKYLTETLAKFWEKLSLPSSIITSYSEIEIPFDWGVSIIELILGKLESITKRKSINGVMADYKIQIFVI